METRYTGETIPISLTVPGLVDLSPFTAVFGLRHTNSRYALKKTPTVSGNVLNVVLNPSETDKAGLYQYEFRIEVDGYVDSVYVGELELIRSVIKEV